MARRHHTHIGGLILVVIGVILLLDNLGIADLSEILHTYWPLFIVLIGVSLVLRRSDSRWKDWDRTSDNQTPPTQSARPWEPNMKQNSGDRISESTVFGDMNLHVTSKNFQGGDVSAVFGDVDVDMADAELPPGEHTLKVHTVFGSTRLYVPRNIGVIAVADSTFGDVRIFDQVRDGIFQKAEFKSEGYDTAEKRLRIEIAQIFGDVKVR